MELKRRNRLSGLLLSIQLPWPHGGRNQMGAEISPEMDSRRVEEHAVLLPMSSSSQRKNVLYDILDDQVTRVAHWDDILDVARNYFINLFQTIHPPPNPADVARNYFINLFQTIHPALNPHLLAGVKSRVSPQLNELLGGPYSKEEMIQAFHEMNPPVPGKVGSVFLNSYWSIVDEDFINNPFDIEF